MAACVASYIAMSASPRAYRAGESLEDFCRACKTDRMHTVIAADAEGRPIRVSCGFCHSEHNYRGGPRVEVRGAERGAAQQTGGGRGGPSPATRATGPAPRSRSDREPFPIVSDRERTAP